MKTQDFIARTKSGVEITITAENTIDEIKTTYPIQLRPISKKSMAFCVVLNKQQAKELLNLDLPPQYKECGVSLLDQDGWQEFDRECRRERYEVEKTRLEELFPGLQALRDARNAEEYYHEQFQRMMEDENNDGARPPKPPKEKYEDLAPKYPKAAAYLKAKGFTLSDNVGKYSAGKKAVRRLEAGEAYETVIAEMEKEWSEYCEKHIWD